MCERLEEGCDDSVVVRSLCQIHYRVSISIGCGTKTGATKFIVEERTTRLRGVCWSFGYSSLPIDKEKRGVSHTEVVKQRDHVSVRNFRDLGDNSCVLN